MDRRNEPETPATTETRRDWEPFQINEGESRTERLKILHGWLYRTITEDGRVAMVHVPD